MCILFVSNTNMMLFFLYVICGCSLPILSALINGRRVCIDGRGGNLINPLTGHVYMLAIF